MRYASLIVLSLLLASCYESTGGEGHDASRDLPPPDSRTDDWTPVDVPHDDYMAPDSPGDPVYDDFVVPDLPLDPSYDDSTPPDLLPDVPVCPPGLTLCGDECVDTSSDPRHCGGCGNVCSYGESCCYGMCVNLSRDPNNCGECGLVCPWGTSDPALNYEGCFDLDLGMYNLCCGGLCLPVSQRRCGACGARCGPGSTCNGLWDAATGECSFVCLSLTGAVGEACTGDDDCTLVPSDARMCITDIAGIVTFPGGYCSARCASSDECGPGAECVDVMIDTLCFKRCTGDDECRTAEGYSCQTMPFGDPETYCIPAY